MSQKEDFGLDSLSKGEIRVAWMEEKLKPFTLTTSDNMMVFKFEVTQDINNITNFLAVSDKVLPIIPFF